MLRQLALQLFLPRWLRGRLLHFLHEIIWINNNYAASCILYTRLEIAHRFRYGEVVLEVDLGCGDESGAHEDAEDREADRVVLLPRVWAARMLGEGGAVVQRDAHEEHGQAPAQAAEHSLVTVSARGRERERERCKEIWTETGWNVLPIRVLA